MNEILKQLDAEERKVLELLREIMLKQGKRLELNFYDDILSAYRGVIRIPLFRGILFRLKEQGIIEDFSEDKNTGKFSLEISDYFSSLANSL